MCSERVLSEQFLHPGCDGQVRPVIIWNMGSAMTRCTRVFLASAFTREKQRPPFPAVIESIPSRNSGNCAKAA